MQLLTLVRIVPHHQIRTSSETRFSEGGQSPHDQRSSAIIGEYLTERREDP